MTSTLSQQRTSPQQTESLLDHVICGSEQLRMKFNAECLGSLEIDDELEFSA
jgi:hypothetical protein